MANKRKHIHQYHRTYPQGYSSGPFKTRGQWECALPDCTHYLPRNMAEPTGKLSVCNGCMDQFVLDEENMKFDKPVCATCAQKNAGVDLDDFDIERYQVKSKIATRTGRQLDEVSDQEVDRQMQFDKLKDM